jgi:hypothetical protein
MQSWALDQLVQRAWVGFDHACQKAPIIIARGACLSTPAAGCGHRVAIRATRVLVVVVHPLRQRVHVRKRGVGCGPRAAPSVMLMPAAIKDADHKADGVFHAPHCDRDARRKSIRQRFTQTQILPLRFVRDLKIH